MFTLPGNGPLAPTPSAPNTPTGAQYQMPQGQDGYFSPKPKYDMGNYGSPRAQGAPMGTPGQDRRAAAEAAEAAAAAEALGSEKNTPAPGLPNGLASAGPGVYGGKNVQGPDAYQPDRGRSQEYPVQSARPQMPMQSARPQMPMQSARPQMPMPMPMPMQSAQPQMQSAQPQMQSAQPSAPRFQSALRGGINTSNPNLQRER